MARFKPTIFYVKQMLTGNQKNTCDVIEMRLPDFVASFGDEGEVLAAGAVSSLASKETFLVTSVGPPFEPSGVPASEFDAGLGSASKCNEAYCHCFRE